MEGINNKIKLSRERLTNIPFRKIAPNIVTMLALCAGVTSIRYSIQEDWMKGALSLL